MNLFPLEFIVPTKSIILADYFEENGFYDKALALRTCGWVLFNNDHRHPSSGYGDGGSVYYRYNGLGEGGGYGAGWGYGDGSGRGDGSGLCDTHNCSDGHGSSSSYRIRV